MSRSLAGPVWDRRPDLRWRPCPACGLLVQRDNWHGNLIERTPYDTRPHRCEGQESPNEEQTS